MTWLTQNICDFLRDLIGGTVEYFGKWINNIFLLVVEWNNENVYVKTAERYFIMLGLALVSLITVKQILGGYVMESDYDSDADPFNLIIRIAQTVAVICSSAWIFNFVLNLSKEFASDVVTATSTVGVSNQVQSLLDIDVTSIGLALSAYYAMIGIIVGALIVFTVISGLRGCELIAMKLFLPVFALDLLTSSRERWKNYFMGYLIAFFTYGVQLLFLTIALKSMASLSFSDPQYGFMALAWLIMGIKAPKFLEKYLYKTGVSSAASSGIRMVAQTAMIAAV